MKRKPKTNEKRIEIARMEQAVEETGQHIAATAESLRQWATARQWARALRPPEVMDGQQLAAFLQVPYDADWLASQRESGHLPSVRFKVKGQTQHRYLLDDVRLWLRMRRKKPVAMKKTLEARDNAILHGPMALMET